jgi:hypothetical protein
MVTMKLVTEVGNLRQRLAYRSGATCTGLVFENRET